MIRHLFPFTPYLILHFISRPVALRPQFVRLLDTLAMQTVKQDVTEEQCK